MKYIKLFEEYNESPKNLRVLYYKGTNYHEVVFSVNYKIVGYIKATDRFEGTHVVEIAGKGYGMLLYKFMLMMLHPGKIIPDRYVVSEDAFKLLSKINKDPHIIKEPITEGDTRFSRKWSHDDLKNSVLNTAYSMKPNMIYNKLRSRMEIVSEDSSEIIAAREFFKEEYSKRKPLS